MEETIKLYYKDSGSDKVYILSLTQDSKGWNVCMKYGGRYNVNNTGCKVSGVAYEKAKKEYDKIVKEKLSKGYKVDSSGSTPVTVISPTVDTKITLLSPQLLNDIPEEKAIELLQNDNWWMEEKFDGRRRGFKLVSSEICATNKKRSEGND